MKEFLLVEFFVGVAQLLQGKEILAQVQGKISRDVRSVRRFIYAVWRKE